MRNVEVKCPLRDRSAVEARLAAMGARRQWTRRQRDTFFVVPKGWLKLREEQGASPELIAYQRATDRATARPSDYERLSLDDAERWLRMLDRALEREAVVEKERTLWLWRHTRVHLDRVTGLGEFLELETVVEGIDLAEAEAECRSTIGALELEPATFLSVPYKDLLTVREQERVSPLEMREGAD